MATALSELAQLVGGQLRGDGTIDISEAATLATAQEGEISFLDGLEKQKLLIQTSLSNNRWLMLVKKN